MGLEICEGKQELISADVLGESNSNVSLFARTSTESNNGNFENNEIEEVEVNSNNVFPKENESNNEEHILTIKTKKSNLKRKLDNDSESEPKPKKKRGICFDSVTVYYFPRAQGFACVPSQGGSTLGMSAHHTHSKKFTIMEHANEQRRIHRQLMQQMQNQNGNASNTSTATSSEESESEEEPSDLSESEMDMDNYYFLQPVPTRQRRALLRAAGVRKIESYEKDDCKDIRTSREFCGCGCKGYCDPETCSCSQAGIKCQVDRLNFPCGCSRDNCANSSGRIEFNPVRVRTHFIHTLMRLELEKKQACEEVTKAGESQEKWLDNEQINVEYKEEKSKNCRIMKFSNVSDAGHRLEDENCVHSGSFTNLHYNTPGEGSEFPIPSGYNDLPARGDSLDLYSFREDCYGEDCTQDGTAFDRKHPFSSSPPTHFPDPPYSDGVFSAASSQYSISSSSNQYSSYHPGLSDFNAVFNPYPTYGEFQDNQKSEQNLTKDVPTCSYQPLLPNNEGFRTEDLNFKENQYTCLNPVESNNKMESFSELIHGRYNSFSSFNKNFTSLNNSVNLKTVDENIENTKVCSETAESTKNSIECGDNFGEIIKKSIVETVSA